MNKYIAFNITAKHLLSMLDKLLKNWALPFTVLAYQLPAIIEAVGKL